MTATGPPGRDLDVAFGELQGGGGEQDGAGHRHLLHAGGQMGRLPDRRVVHVEIRPDGADDHLARVEAHADLEGHPVRAEDPLRVLRDRLLHAQRRIARPYRVVLVSKRGAEQRHDAIAHDLVHGSIVAVDCLHHAFEHGVEELARILGIAVGEQLHRPLQVGEQNRHLLALAFKGRLRVKDAFSEVLRGVVLGGAEACGRGGWRQCRRLGALRAELGGWGELTAAVSTCPRQGRGAFLAELSAGLVLVLAPRTFHCEPRACQAI